MWGNTVPWDMRVLSSAPDEFSVWAEIWALLMYAWTPVMWEGFLPYSMLTMLTVQNETYVRMKIRAHIIWRKGEGTPWKTGRLRCAWAKASHGIYLVRRHSLQVVGWSLPFISLASITMHNPKTFWNVKTVHLTFSKWSISTLCWKHLWVLSLFRLSDSFNHSEPFLSNKCYPDFLPPLLSFLFSNG